MGKSISEDTAKLRFVWWTLAVTAVVCLLLGVSFLVGALSGPHLLGVAAFIGGAIGLVGATDLRRFSRPRQLAERDHD